LKRNKVMAASLDLFKMAARNGPVLKSRFEAELAGLDAATAQTVTQFADEVSRTGQISLNRKPMDLRNELEAKQFDNIYRKVRPRLRHSSRSEDQIMAGENPDYHRKRKGFQKVFRGEDDFIYGALNTGGMGALGFDRFCVILSPVRLAANCGMAYLRGDSLQTYVQPSGSVKRAKLAADCASEAHKHHLCALKHSKLVPTWKPQEWCALVCNNDDYVEAVIGGPVSTKHATAVRMFRSEYTRYWHMAFDENRRDLDDLNIRLADDFDRIDRCMETAKIKWEPIDD
jgi:hypothetical protein